MANEHKKYVQQMVASGIVDQVALPPSLAENDLDENFTDMLCREVPDRHDDIQLEHFVVQQNAFNTVWGSLRQLSMELRARQKAIQSLRSEYMRLVWKNDDIKRKVTSFWWRLFKSSNEISEMELQLEESVSRMEVICEKGSNVMAEQKKLMELAREVYGRAGNLKDPAHRRKLQEEFWASKFSYQAELAAELQRIDVSLLEVLVNLPDTVYSSVSRSLPDTLRTTLQKYRRDPHMSFIHAAMLDSTGVTIPDKEDIKDGEFT